MKVLTVNMHSSSGLDQPLRYRDVKKWDWGENHVSILLEDEDTAIVLNATYIIGVVWKDEPEPEPEPEEPEMRDVDDNG